MNGRTSGLIELSVGIIIKVRNDSFDIIALFYRKIFVLVERNRIVSLASEQNGDKNKGIEKYIHLICRYFHTK